MVRARHALALRHYPGSVGESPIITRLRGLVAKTDPFLAPAEHDRRNGMPIAGSQEQVEVRLLVGSVGDDSSHF